MFLLSRVETLHIGGCLKHTFVLSSVFPNYFLQSLHSKCTSQLCAVA